MSAYRQPKFLTDNDQPNYRIRCPIHGFIRYSEHERQIIDHRLFQRLRFIRQLALTELVYPGATHTRFEHSLGVMDVATRAFDCIASKHGDLLETTFRSVAGFENDSMAKARQVLRLSALLHDIGHAAFSHAAEDVVFGKDFGHEQLSVDIVRQTGFLGTLIDECFWSGCADRVSQVLAGGHILPPQLQVLKDIVSGQMDADRTDYLIRDSYHCGVDYGRFDFRRMIECLEIIESEGGRLEIALNFDGMHTFEALILARYQMNTQVYYHRLRRIFDLYLREYHIALGADAPRTQEAILNNNDFTMIQRIIKDAATGEGERKKWASRIFERRHHRVVFDTGENADARIIRNAKVRFAELKSSFKDVELLFDEAEGSIHKLFIPGDMDDKGLDLYLTKSGHKPKSIVSESQILGKIPRKFLCGRIFADVKRHDKDLRKKLQDSAN